MKIVQTPTRKPAIGPKKADWDKLYKIYETRYNEAKTGTKTVKTKIGSSSWVHTEQKGGQPMRAKYDKESFIQAYKIAYDDNKQNVIRNLVQNQKQFKFNEFIESYKEKNPNANKFQAMREFTRIKNQFNAELNGYSFESSGSSTEGTPYKNVAQAFVASMTDQGQKAEALAILGY